MSCRFMVKILKLWIKHIFSKDIINIIIGIYNGIFHKEESLYSKRYTKCAICKYKETVSPVGEICSICGCILKNKLRVPEENCELGKW